MAGLSQILERFTPVKSGEPLREVYPASWRMDVQQAISAIARGEHIEVGEGITKLSTPSSVLLRSNAQSKGKGVAPAMLPLQPYDASIEKATKIGVTNGTFGGNVELTVGASVPLIGGTRIDYSTPPSLDVSSDSKLIYLKVTVNLNGAISEVKVEVGSDVNPPSPTQYTIFYVRLCTIAVTSDGSLSLGSYELGGSQTYELCGGTTNLYRLS